MQMGLSTELPPTYIRPLCSLHAVTVHVALVNQIGFELLLMTSYVVVYRNHKSSTHAVCSDMFSIEGMRADCRWGRGGVWGEWRE